MSGGAVILTYHLPTYRSPRLVAPSLLPRPLFNPAKATGSRIEAEIKGDWVLLAPTSRDTHSNDALRGFTFTLCPRQGEGIFRLEPHRFHNNYSAAQFLMTNDFDGDKKYKESMKVWSVCSILGPR